MQLQKPHDIDYDACVLASLPLPTTTSPPSEGLSSRTFTAAGSQCKSKRRQSNLQRRPCNNIKSRVAYAFCTKWARNSLTWRHLHKRQLRLKYAQQTQECAGIAHIIAYVPFDLWARKPLPDCCADLTNLHVFYVCNASSTTGGRVFRPPNRLLLLPMMWVQSNCSLPVLSSIALFHRVSKHGAMMWAQNN